MSIGLSPIGRFWLGLGYAGFKLFTYAAGTTTKQNTFTDSTGATPNTNPIILDANGSAAVFLTQELLYKFVVASPTDSDPPTSPIWTQDNIAALNSSYTPPGTGAVATTVGAELAVLYKPVTDFMTAAQIADVQANTLTQDVTAALNAFFLYCTTYGVHGTLISGSYSVTGNLLISIGTKGFTIDGPSANSTVIVAKSSFSGSTMVMQIKGNGTAIGWRIGGFTITGVSGTGTAIIGLQIGDPTTAAINILAYQFSTLFDIEIDNFATLWQFTHCRMIRIQDCAGWNSGFGSNNTVLSITQNGSFTGDLLFDKFVGVTSTSGTNTVVSINSPVGPYNIVTAAYSIAGIKFRTCDFFYGTTAISIYATAGSYIADIWFIDGCEHDATTTNAITINSNNSGTLIEDVRILDMFIQKSTSQTILLESTGTLGVIKSVWICRNEIINAQSNAIDIFGSGCQNIWVQDNSIVDCAAAGPAIEVNGTTGITITNNRLRRGFVGANPYYLVQLESGTTGIVCQGNTADVGSYGIGIVNDASGSTPKIVNDNLLYNPIATTLITVSGSPFTWTNTTGAPAIVALNLNGATISVFAINGLAITNPVIALTQWTVPNAGSFAITYSAAIPVLAYVGM